MGIKETQISTSSSECKSSLRGEKAVRYSFLMCAHLDVGLAKVSPPRPPPHRLRYVAGGLLTKDRPLYAILKKETCSALPLVALAFDLASSLGGRMASKVKHGVSLGKVLSPAHLYKGETALLIKLELGKSRLATYTKYLVSTIYLDLGSKSFATSILLSCCLYKSTNTMDSKQGMTIDKKSAIENIVPLSQDQLGGEAPPPYVANEPSSSRAPTSSTSGPIATLHVYQPRWFSMKWLVTTESASSTPEDKLPAPLYVAQSSLKKPHVTISRTVDEQPSDLDQGKSSKDKAQSASQTVATATYHCTTWRIDMTFPTMTGSSTVPMKTTDAWCNKYSYPSPAFGNSNIQWRIGKPNERCNLDCKDAQGRLLARVVFRDWSKKKLFRIEINCEEFCKGNGRDEVVSAATAVALVREIWLYGFAP